MTFPFGCIVYYSSVDELYIKQVWEQQKKKEKKTSCWWMNDYIHISIVEEANRNSRRVHTHTHTCTWVLSFDSTDSSVRVLAEGKGKSSTLSNEERMRVYREKEERTSFNCSSRPRTYMRRVYVCLCHQLHSFADLCRWSN